jgi:hypothetical protein
MDEPQIRVGIIQRADRMAYELSAGYVSDDGLALEQRLRRGLSGPFSHHACCTFAKFAVNGVEIGIGFHWNRRSDRSSGAGWYQPNVAGGITLVNELGLESYLESVISSEMSEESRGTSEGSFSDRKKLGDSPAEPSTPREYGKRRVAAGRYQQMV